VWKRWLKQEDVHAIHKRDLESILRDLGLLDDLLAGLLMCGICQTPLTIDTLQCLFVQGGRVRLCCKNAACYAQVLSKRGKFNG